MKTRVSSLFANGLARNTTAVWAIYMFNWVAWFMLLVMFTFGILLIVGLGNSGTNWTWVFILAGAAGLGIGGQQIVLNYMVAQAYPTTLRATATGWAIAVGRIGAIIGSASGGWVLEQVGTSGFYMSLALPLAIATAALIIIKPVEKTKPNELAAA